MSMSEGGVVTQVPFERSVKLARHSVQSEGRGPSQCAQLSAHDRHSVITTDVSAGEVVVVVVDVEVLAVVELLVEVSVCASDVDVVVLVSEELAPLAVVVVVVVGVVVVEVFEVPPSLAAADVTATDV